ncbi:MAG: glycosyltransferase family 4 protein [Sphingobacteriia bacterium]|nr:glycosyltransferase family 4 protein [Sphingobacteriia bacterium]
MKKNILIDCERMRYPFTGLYTFCNQLVKSLLPELSAAEQLTIYGPASLEKVFGPRAHYDHHHAYHKLLAPAAKGVDCWHATHQGTDYFPRNKRTKLVLTVHDINFMHEHTKTAAKQKSYLAKLRLKAERADHMVFISDFVKNDFSRYIPLNDKPVSVIYNGCETATVAISEKPATAPDAPFIFALGLITAKKNFHVLPALLVNNDLKLVIGGSVQQQEYRKQIEAAARKQGVADRVIFTGAISEQDKQWYYQHCTAFAFPSIAEGFGLPAVEAMRYGKPVFLSDQTSLPEIGGNAAFYFTDFDAAAMQEVFSGGMRQYQEQSMEKMIRQHAAKFSWSDTAKQYLDVYRQLY